MPPAEPFAHKPMTSLVDRIEIATATQDEHRRHLGASIIGRACEREIFYKFRWAARARHSGRVSRLFLRGHREEAELAKWLRAAKAKVTLATDSDRDKEFLRIHDFDGHFGGTADGVVGDLDELSGKTALLECKTHNDASFHKLKADGLTSAKFEHYVQMQIYMHYLGLAVGLYMAVNKNDDELHTEIVYPDPVLVARYRERAERIIQATVPPPRINNSPAWWQCKFCDYAQLCHFPELEYPLINCRTCAYAAQAKNGAWLCHRDRMEIFDAQETGCEEHQYNYEWFGWEIVDWDFEKNIVKVKTSSTNETFTARKSSNSAALFKSGIIPF